MFRLRLHSPDGDDLGEATYAQMIRAGEEIIAGRNKRFRVLDVAPFAQEDESAFVGLAAGRSGLGVSQARGAWLVHTLHNESVVRRARTSGTFSRRLTRHGPDPLDR
jgi:hypothetical protein